jgi:hypothetical protein
MGTPLSGRALALATLAALAASCREHPPLQSCSDAIGGIWRSTAATATTAAPPRWSILDDGQRIEIYPLFDDAIVISAVTSVATSAATALPPSAPASDSAAFVLSPRSFELIRARIALPGHVQRWVMRGERWCQQRAAARAVACHDDALTLEAEVLPLPEGELLCSPGGPSVAERWLRDD